VTEQLTPYQTQAIARTVAMKGDIPHIGIDAVRLIAQAAHDNSIPSVKDRNQLLIFVMFDACLRVSEALQLAMTNLRQSADGWTVTVVAKGGKYHSAAISADTVHRLQRYAYNAGIAPGAKLFPIGRHRAWAIMRAAFKTAGIMKPPGVGFNHVFRHSGLIHRMETTGNPKAVQDQAGHTNARMTMRYMGTVTKKRSMQINQQQQVTW
jgi:integrase